MAEKAFDLLDELAQAWEDRDCATVDRLTAWAENALGGRACEATRNGRPALTGYSDLEYLLPEAPGWFAVLARRPEPTYFLFVHDRNWRLAAGPLRLLGEAPERADGAEPSSGTARRARLVPQRHLTYLTDPAGVSGVAFPSGDAIADLRDELADRTARAPSRQGERRRRALRRPVPRAGAVERLDAGLPHPPPGLAPPPRPGQELPRPPAVRQGAGEGVHRRERPRLPDRHRARRAGQ
ncbi:hypothetical protein [Nonomuraea dietziae]|uniref:hypothetical protein n=1 Tax=Nonomuraea dietziae TaxID=65515 RepID=UPI0031E02D03